MNKYHTPDPFWIITTLDGRCAKTGEPYSSGDRVFYFPGTKECYAGDSAAYAAIQFEAECLFKQAVGPGGK